MYVFSLMTHFDKKIKHKKRGKLLFLFFVWQIKIINRGHSLLYGHRYFGWWLRHRVQYLWLCVRQYGR